MAILVCFGLLWALVASLFPPTDLLAIFILGTWPLSLAAIGAWGIGAVIHSQTDE